jgi:hypothetical protein
MSFSIITSAHGNGDGDNPQNAEYKLLHKAESLRRLITNASTVFSYFSADSYLHMD